MSIAWSSVIGTAGRILYRLAVLFLLSNMMLDLYRIAVMAAHTSVCA